MLKPSTQKTDFEKLFLADCLNQAMDGLTQKKNQVLKAFNYDLNFIKKLSKNPKTQPELKQTCEAIMHDYKPRYQ
ncbi:MAG: hypothetical protein ACOWWR_18390 [Eubacteriales bacterium]